jgi:hypothetical protein
MSPDLAHRDMLHCGGRASLSGHCGHGPIFGAQRSVANDPHQKWAGEYYTLFNQLVSGGEKRLGDGQAEGFGGLEVDDQFDLHRLLYWQIRGPLAL